MNIKRKKGGALHDVRKSAGLSLEKAAEMLFMSRRTISQYERCEDVPAKAIIAITEVYQNHYLPALYCSLCCPIGCKEEYEVDEEVDLTKASAHLIDEMREVQKVLPVLIEESSHGVVSSEGIFSKLHTLEKGLRTIRLYAQANGMYKYGTHVAKTAQI